MKLRSLFLLLLVLFAYPTIGKAESFDNDGFCFVMAELLDASKGNKDGMKAGDFLVFDVVSLDCKKKSVAFSAKVNADLKKAGNKPLDAFLCVEGGKEPNPYVQAVKNGWNLDVSYTYADGTKQSAKLCQ